METQTKIDANVQQAVPFFMVSSMETSLRFYVDGLGFEMKKKWTPDGDGKVRWCWLELGDAALMLQEFKKFAMRGSVVDLAIGVIIGAAFGKIVGSLVDDVIMPVIGRIFGGLDFSNYFIALKSPPAGYSGPMTYEALTKAGVPLFAYGNFITVLIYFIILAFIIFLMVKQINRLKRSEPAASAVPAPTPEDIVLLREIRDSLRKWSTISTSTTTPSRNQ